MLKIRREIKGIWEEKKDEDDIAGVCIFEMHSQKSAPKFKKEILHWSKGGTNGEGSQECTVTVFSVDMKLS